MRQRLTTAVTEAQTTQVSVEFGERAVQTVSGHLIDPQGAVVDLGSVAFLRTLDGSRFTASGDNCGSYSVNLPEGTYNAIVQADGFDVLNVLAAVVVAGSPIDRNFTLSPANFGVIRGVVKEQGTLELLQGLQVCARLAPQVPRCVDTDLKGHFVLPNLKVGVAYKVTFESRVDHEALLVYLQASQLGAEISEQVSRTPTDVHETLDDTVPIGLRPVSQRGPVKLSPEGHAGALVPGRGRHRLAPIRWDRWQVLCAEPRWDALLDRPDTRGPLPRSDEGTGRGR